MQHVCFLMLQPLPSPYFLCGLLDGKLHRAIDMDFPNRNSLCLGFYSINIFRRLVVNIIMALLLGHDHGHRRGDGHGHSYGFTVSTHHDAKHAKDEHHHKHDHTYHHDDHHSKDESKTKKKKQLNINVQGLISMSLEILFRVLE
ncbi:uncharacterized protein HKW66_Vig0172330 [Vigna angularis]|uniref:Uncharacterized protein n=1 Tax=Phaseolus angularis TaxID=3914 RepID=A0A8T0JQV2_PHAAN|nr:uncharacterized protein HKW66_Vig0172330 [Vigna angularis]